jgi:hypothetical protein
MFAKFVSVNDDKVRIYIDPTKVSSIEACGDKDTCLRVDGFALFVRGTAEDSVALIDTVLYDRAYEMGKATARAALHAAVQP